jgi:hypothetical protein
MAALMTCWNIWLCDTVISSKRYHMWCACFVPISLNCFGWIIMTSFLCIVLYTCIDCTFLTKGISDTKQTKWDEWCKVADYLSSTWKWMIGCHGVFPLDLETKSANYTYHVESMKFFRRLLSVATIFQRSYRSYYIHPFTCFRKKRKAWCRLSDISRWFDKLWIGYRTRCGRSSKCVHPFVPASAVAGIW